MPPRQSGRAPAPVPLAYLPSNAAFVNDSESLNHSDISSGRCLRQMYGGGYGPTFTAFFMKYKEKIRNADMEYEASESSPVSSDIPRLPITRPMASNLSLKPNRGHHFNVFAILMATKAGCQYAKGWKEPDSGNIGNAGQVNKSYRFTGYFALNGSRV
ncbi:unnamed protein product [Tuber aestivum]|uniref:Uncharacterized protein n=1 Tax=Tuber aestivum TaxID=59557 RepID=A0A292PL67_9PEZI|nr:unnamed protein product [Tuber aestivum]